MPVAAIYSAVVSAWLPPELSEPECKAIADAMFAVASKYGPSFQHWEVVALVGAMATPVMMRYAQKAKEDVGKNNSPVN